MKDFFNTLKSGGFGSSGGLKGLGEEIRQRTNVTSTSSSSRREVPKITDINPTTVPKPYTPSKEERRVMNRKVENLVDMVSPSAAEKLKKFNRNTENFEDTIENFIDANNLINITTRLITKESQLSIADHLFVQRVGYTHHGLYIGNKQVIHYVIDKGVSKVSLEEFASAANIHIKDSLKIHANDKILARAYSRIGEDNYNLFNNNCENFVNWCRSRRD